jgi:formylglycine-generating enzyme required for sulfatase activity
MIRILITLMLLSFIATSDCAAGPGSFREPLSGIDFVAVKGGCFRMGNNYGWDDTWDEKPEHEVCLSNFYLGKFEVTQKQWQALMGSNPARFKECGPDCPVESISWQDIQEFLKRLNKKSGKRFRLPTEAEWEYAARSGGRKERFSGGNSLSQLGWYQENSANVIHPVGQKQPNGLGLYDMSGNVWEWVQDWHSPEYYGQSLRNNPQGPAKGACRVVRGGCISTEAHLARNDHRRLNDPEGRFNLVGFRIAITSP